MNQANAKVKKIKVTHDRKTCIGCNHCVTVCPQNWIMDETDGKARLIGSKLKRDVYVGEAFEMDREDNEIAAEGCPVSIIKVL